MSQQIKQQQQQRQQQQTPQPSARREAVEDLASRIFAQKVATISGRIPNALAVESIEIAKVFYRTCDEHLVDM